MLQTFKITKVLQSFLINIVLQHYYDNKKTTRLKQDTMNPIAYNIANTLVDAQFKNGSARKDLKDCFRDRFIFP